MVIPSRTSKAYLIPILVFHELVFQPRPTNHTMSENPKASFHPVTSPAEHLPLPRKSEVKPPDVMQEWCPLTPSPSRRSGEEREEREGDITAPPRWETSDCTDGSRGRQETEVGGNLIGITEDRALESPAVGPGGGGEVMDVCGREDRNEGPPPQISDGDDCFEDVRRRTQRIREKEELLKQTEKLLATRSAELSGVHAFLSATDRLSEVEVLRFVHDLNENIYQVAVNLTDEWEKLESSQATGRMDVDSVSRSRGPALDQRAISRNPVGLTFLLQSCLCSQVAKMTSSWGHHQELAILESIYQHLSASGEYDIVNLRQYVTYIS